MAGPVIRLGDKTSHRSALAVAVAGAVVMRSGGQRGCGATPAAGRQNTIGPA